MSSSIQNACMSVARTNMWENKPTDTSPLINYQEQLVEISLNALEQYKELGATEQNVADAIYYIEQVYALPPIGNNANWFKEKLCTLLEIAFTDNGVSAEAARFANIIIAGLKRQMA